jgi:CubicO group peptidase (beta-lactamase class C family)
VVKLAARGALRLDDPVAEHVPELPWRPADRRLTVRHAIRHQGGLRPELDDLDRYGDGEQATLAALGEILRSPRRFRPGRAWEYANSGYWLAGLVAGRRAGGGLAAVLHELVLAPAGMDATAFARAGGERYPPAGNAGGGLVATVGDLLRFARALFDDPAWVERVGRDGAVRSQSGPRYGHGWEIEQRRGATILSHGGGWLDYESRIFVVPERRFAYVGLSTEPGYVREAGADILEAATGLRVTSPRLRLLAAVPARARFRLAAALAR